MTTNGADGCAAAASVMPKMHSRKGSNTGDILLVLVFISHLLIKLSWCRANVLSINKRFGFICVKSGQIDTATEDETSKITGSIIGKYYIEKPFEITNLKEKIDNGPKDKIYDVDFAHNDFEKLEKERYYNILVDDSNGDGGTTNDADSNESIDFELDDGSLLAEKGRENAFAKGDVLWIHRKLSSEDIDRLLNSNKIGIWTEDNSVMRWGIEIDIYPVQRKMREFMSGCRTANSNSNLDATLSSFWRWIFSV